LCGAGEKYSNFLISLVGVLTGNWVVKKSDYELFVQNLEIVQSPDKWRGQAEALPQWE